MPPRKSKSFSRFPRKSSRKNPPRKSSRKNSRKKISLKSLLSKIARKNSRNTSLKKPRSRRHDPPVYVRPKTRVVHHVYHSPRPLMIRQPVPHAVLSPPPPPPTTEHIPMGLPVAKKESEHIPMGLPVSNRAVRFEACGSSADCVSPLRCQENICIDPTQDF